MTLQSLRRARGMTLATVAQLLHVAPSLLRAWEAGWLVPSALRRYELAVAYEVSEDLIDLAVTMGRCSLPRDTKDLAG